MPLLSPGRVPTASTAPTHAAGEELEPGCGSVALRALVLTAPPLHLAP